MNIEDKISIIQNELKKNFNRKINCLLSFTESPIEKLFFSHLINYLMELSMLDGAISFHSSAILFQDIHSDEQFKKPNVYDNLNPYAIDGIILESQSKTIKAFPQFSVAVNDRNFRIDIAIFYKHAGDKLFPKMEKKFCIECDGHEFHQKTKEQVEKDYNRRRLLSEHGWEVISYSGSEIYKINTPKDFSQLMFQMNHIAFAK